MLQGKQATQKINSFGLMNALEDVITELTELNGMTDPSYLPIMKRALAFVTNEGGVLCHAAIVARELKKPCIIGTKHATHIFKDGDLVEVDAIQGIIKKCG